MYEKKYEDYDEIDLSEFLVDEFVPKIKFFRVGEEIILSEEEVSVLLVADFDNIYTKPYPEILKWFSDFIEKYKLPQDNSLIIILYYPKFSYDSIKQIVKELVEKNEAGDTSGVLTPHGSFNFLRFTYENY